MERFNHNNINKDSHYENVSQIICRGRGAGRSGFARGESNQPPIAPVKGFGIASAIFGIVCYSIWYFIMKTHWDYFLDNKEFFYQLSYLCNAVIYISIAFFILSLSFLEKNINTRLFIYFSIAEFWGLLGFSQIIKIFLGSGKYNEVLWMLLIILLINISIWSFRYYYQHTN